MQQAKRAAIEFTLEWDSLVARHVDRLFLAKIDFWRDIFPGDLENAIAALQPGESVSREFPPGELTPAYDNGRRVRFRANLFDASSSSLLILPTVGRFYPQGFAPRAFGVYQGDFTPFRLIDNDETTLMGDSNHPLARYPLKLTATLVEHLSAIEEHGGVCTDIAEEVTLRGPGMQASCPDVDTDFYAVYPFPRGNEENDAEYYKNPRLVPHLDSLARAQLGELHGRLLEPGSKVLDLMSSQLSHVPPEKQLDLVGLGMNREELQANEQLDEWLVHDLNREVTLPFADHSFDSVICSSSVEYLRDPLAVFAEVARVLRPGGLFLCSFSDRWFPGKQILPWGEMHPFERLGLVLDLTRKSGRFESLNTLSIRGYPRPEDDRHIDITPNADPLFAVWGSLKA